MSTVQDIQHSKNSPTSGSPISTWRELETTPCRSSKVAIPTIVMQTWKTETLPAVWQPSQDSILKYLPAWSYILMTDSANREFIATYFPDYLETFDRFPYPIQRADAIRYAWLYRFGGLYLDCDSELLESIDYLFAGPGELYLLASSNTPTVLTNGLMASIPQHPIWLAMLAETRLAVGIMSLERHLHVMHSTGPVALSRVVKREAPNYVQLPTAKLNPLTMCETIANSPLPVGAAIRQLPGSSWVGGVGSVYQWCWCRATTLLVALLLLAVLLCGWCI